MAGSSSKFTLHTLSGLEGYPVWSKKMKKDLVSEGLWHLVERGVIKPKAGENLNDRESHLLRKYMVNDATVLSRIRKSLSPTLCLKINEASTAKEAWDILYDMFQANKEENVPPYIESKKKLPKMPTEISNKSDIGEDDGVMPLSGDKPFFDMCLLKSAVNRPYHLNFPARVHSMLPSTDVVANVRFSGRFYEIKFFGQKRKSFGSGWRQLVNEHKLLEGDFLVFEIVENDDSKFEINLQVLRNTIPPELEAEIRKREAEFKDKAIRIDDDDNDDETINIDDHDDEEDEDEEWDSDEDEDEEWDGDEDEDVDDVSDGDESS